MRFGQFLSAGSFFGFALFKVLDLSAKAITIDATEGAFCMAGNIWKILVAMAL